MEPNKGALEAAARAISGCHCDRARRAHQEAVRKGTWKEGGILTAYNGRFLHEMPPGGWPLPPGIEHATEHL